MYLNQCSCVRVYLPSPSCRFPAWPKGHIDKSIEVSNSTCFNGVSIPLWIYTSGKPLRERSIVTQNYQNCTKIRILKGKFLLYLHGQTELMIKKGCVISKALFTCIFSCLCWSNIAPFSPPPQYICAFQLLFDLFQSWLKIIPYRISQWNGSSSDQYNISAWPLFFCSYPLDQLLLLNSFFINPFEISLLTFCVCWGQDQRLRTVLSPEVCRAPAPSLCFGVDYCFGLSLFSFASQDGAHPHLPQYKTHLIKSYSRSFGKKKKKFASTNAHVKQQSYNTFPKLPIQSRKEQNNFNSLVGLNCHCKYPQLAPRAGEKVACHGFAGSFWHLHAP